MKNVFGVARLKKGNSAFEISETVLNSNEPANR